MQAMGSGYARFTFVVVATLLTIHALDLQMTPDADPAHSAATTAKFFTGTRLLRFDSIQCCSTAVQASVYFLMPASYCCCHLSAGACSSQCLRVCCCRCSRVSDVESGGADGHCDALSGQLTATPQRQPHAARPAVRESATQAPAPILRDASCRRCSIRHCRSGTGGKPYNQHCLYLSGGPQCPRHSQLELYLR